MVAHLSLANDSQANLIFHRSKKSKLSFVTMSLICFHIPQDNVSFMFLFYSTVLIICLSIAKLKKNKCTQEDSDFH